MQDRPLHWLVKHWFVPGDVKQNPRRCGSLRLTQRADVRHLSLKGRLPLLVIALLHFNEVLGKEYAAEFAGGSCDAEQDLSDLFGGVWCRGEQGEV
jgi:hypothetical protein